MSKESGGPGDQYSRVEYRRLIAWQRRIERESPYLLSLLDRAPDRSVLDLGCGTGEHTAFFAQRGARAVGLDRSESMIEAAQEHESRGDGRFVLGDALSAHPVLPDEPPFGLAICLGNMLPHVQEDDELDTLLASAHSLLLPGGLLLVQLLNYERILSQDIRHLPVNMRAGDDDRTEIVFLRLMKDAGGGRILFFPTTLELQHDAEEPVTVRGTRRVPLRAWTPADLTPRFASAGFDAALHGDMHGGPYEASSSHDLVLVATRT